MTKTAVSDQDGASEFFSDHDFNNLEWGGTIIGKIKLKIPRTIFLVFKFTNFYHFANLKKSSNF